MRRVATTWRALALAVLAVVCALRMPYAAVHLDLAHDLFVASNMLEHHEIPWSGRILAGTIHLGPVYYWLLALLLWLGRGWFGATLLLGALAATQIPLAYLAGKALRSRRAGALWALLLLLPSWSSFEWLFPGHNLLTAPLVLAFVLCAARYARRPRLRYLIGMASIFVLALHAHPTTLALAWIGAGVLAWACYQRRCTLRQLLIAAGIGLLPLVPYAIWDAAHGFADLQSGADYLGDAERTGHLSAMVPLLYATALGGTRYWFDAIVPAPPIVADTAMLLIVLVGAAGTIGLLRAARAREQRALVLTGLATVTAALLTTALIRSVTPYYMTVVLRTLLLGLLAVGLDALGAGRVAQGIRFAAGALAVALFACCATVAARLQMRGDWPFSFQPLFNVIAPASPTQPFFMLPGYASGAAGAFLCAAHAPSIHGVFAQQLLHDYAIDMRLACGRSDVELGGSGADREHWLGLSRALFARLGLRPPQHFGSLGIVAARPLDFGTALAPQSAPLYPAYAPKTQASGPRTVRTHLAAAEHLAVANVAFGFVPNPRLRVLIDGKATAATAQDAVASVYGCDQCSATGADIEVTIDSIDPADVDIVVF